MFRLLKVDLPSSSGFERSGLKLTNLLTYLFILYSLFHNVRHMNMYVFGQRRPR